MLLFCKGPQQLLSVSLPELPAKELMGLLFVELKGHILVTPHHQQQHYQMNLEPLVIWWSSGDLCLRSHVSLNCRLVNIYSAATAHPDPVRLTLNSLSSKVGIWFFSSFFLKLFVFVFCCFWGGWCSGKMIERLWCGLPNTIYYAY